ncbi:MAG TPA: cytochrome b [Acetobacteraceae bacterium]|nr:cytochrome b [Acetobacteraceae bacterium]
MQTRQAAARIAPGDEASRYDALTRMLHWGTVVLVILLYGLAQIWDFLPRGSAPRHALQSLHISLGVMLTLVILARIPWRLGLGRRLPPATPGWTDKAARGMHHLLYLLLLTMVVTGFGNRWTHGAPLEIFGLIGLPSPFGAMAPATVHLIGAVHNTVATGIMICAGLHAAAALFHHFLLRDGVLRRMLPDRTGT